MFLSFVYIYTLIHHASIKDLDPFLGELQKVTQNTHSGHGGPGTSALHDQWARAISLSVEQDNIVRSTKGSRERMSNGVSNGISGTFLRGTEEGKV